MNDDAVRNHGISTDPSYGRIASSGRPMNILQVEDTRSDVVLTAHALKSAGIPYTLQVVGSGSEAISFLQRKEGFEGVPRPDLILLDLSLPGVNGHDVLKFVKSDSELKTIPVVVFTTMAAEESQVMAYENSANSYVLKPLDLEKFTSVVQSIAAYWCLTSSLVPVRTDR